MKINNKIYLYYILEHFKFDLKDKKGKASINQYILLGILFGLLVSYLLIFFQSDRLIIIFGNKFICSPRWGFTCYPMYQGIVLFIGAGIGALVGIIVGGLTSMRNKLIKN